MTEDRQFRVTAKQNQYSISGIYWAIDEEQAAVMFESAYPDWEIEDIWQI